MKALNVGGQMRNDLVEVIRQRCSNIGRTWLQDVNPKEVVVVTICESQEVFVCRVRGMTYMICIKKDQERIGVFDPNLSAPIGSGTKISSNYPNEERH